MQKAITTSNNTNQELDPYFLLQAEVGMCPTLVYPTPGTVAASTQHNNLTYHISSEEVYAELPMTNDADQQEKQEKQENEENEESATQSEAQDNLQDRTENTQVAQSNGWVSRLTSVPSKIVSSFNPLNSLQYWFSSKNTSPPEQPKIIIIEQQDLSEGEPSATLSEVEKSLHPTQKFPSALDPLTPDDSEFTDADSDLTGNESNLLDN